MDVGITWVSNSVPVKYWISVASSADGDKQFAANYGGGIWISQTVPKSKLTINFSATDVMLSWTIPSTDFVLQQSPDLTSWSSVTDTPALNLGNLQNQVRLPPTNSLGYFRLSTP